MTVENMTSNNTERKIPNQFIIYNVTKELSFTEDNNNYHGFFTGVMFQSYRSNIVFKASGKTFLDSYYWDYSKTTGKYRNQFLGETKKETEKKISSGIYILTDLNQE